MSAPGDHATPSTPAAAGVGYAVLAPSDLDRVYEVHLAAMAAVGDPRLVKPENRAFFERLLDGEGRLLGAFRGDALIGYGVLQILLPPSEDARPYLGLPEDDGLAKLAGAGVRPSEWGAGLHDQFIDWRVAEARRLEIAHLYATAAPGNPRSWANLMAGGFAVRALQEKYGGYLRYFLWRRAKVPATQEAEAPPPDPSAGLWLASEDIPGQRAALAEGRLGLRWRRRADGGRDLWYAHP